MAQRFELPPLVISQWHYCITYNVTRWSVLTTADVAFYVPPTEDSACMCFSEGCVQTLTMITFMRIGRVF